MAEGANERDFIAQMRRLATSGAARKLADDAALLEEAGARIVLTTDTMVEGVHYRADDPADSIGWKLAAVNLSDLAAKGAEPIGCLVNYALSGDAGWDADFATGLGDALSAFSMPLLGGDTVRMPPDAPRSLTLTALGRAQAHVPNRSGARPGDILYVTGPVGDAGAGLQLLQQRASAPAELIAAYRRPVPRLAQGYALARHAHAMMDISDGLLLDARRMAQASGVAIRIEHVPLSPALTALHSASVEARLSAACAGDDYELLAALPADFETAGHPFLVRVGSIGEGIGLSLCLDGVEQTLPPRLGYEH